MFVQDTGKQAVTQISATFLDALSFHHDWEDGDEESSSLYISRGLYVEGCKKQISVAKYWLLSIKNSQHLAGKNSYFRRSQWYGMMLRSSNYWPYSVLAPIEKE